MEVVSAGADVDAGVELAQPIRIRGTSSRTDVMNNNFFIFVPHAIINPLGLFHFVENVIVLPPSTGC